MSAGKTKKSKLETVKTLGVIAGGGRLPFMLLEACKDNNIKPYILAFENQTDRNLVDNVEHSWTSLGALQKNLETLKAHGIKDLVFCGHIKRPSLKELKPDLRAAKFFARNSFKALGDNDLLTAVKEEVAKDGFTLHGVHDFVENLLASSGNLTKKKPSSKDMSDIEYGYKVSQEMGRLDVGQSVIVQDGLVIGVEAVEGTDVLMQRSKDLMKESKTKGVLVKTCKPQQDKDLDLPTVGVQTIINASKLGLAGIAVHAGQSIVLDCEAVIKQADKEGLFCMGYQYEETIHHSGRNVR